VVRAAPLIFVLLVGCQKKADDHICIVPMSLEQSLKLGNDSASWQQKVDACVSRWGMRLAQGPDSINEVAEATIGGCTDALTSATSSEFQEYRQHNIAPPDWDAALADKRKTALGLARFYVALARAGHCPVP